MEIGADAFEKIASTIKGKRIVVTGHSGFKGGWLSLWLSELGARVFGISLPPTQPEGIYEKLGTSVFENEEFADICEPNRISEFLTKHEPDFVFHLAAQPLVRLSYADPISTITSNVMGSAYLLEGVRKLDKTCHTVFVTSDKCYQNKEWQYSYRENDPLGGKDPYSMSKAAAELVAESYRRSYFDHHPRGSRVVSVRAGNVIGGGDYSMDRLVPDCVRSAIAGESLVIRSPKSTRPWQHVLDCLFGYLVLASRISGLPATAEFESFNFGPNEMGAHSVAEVAAAFFHCWGPSAPGVVIQASDNSLAEAGYLAVSIEKSQRLLQWRPVWSFGEAIGKTAEWYLENQSPSSDMLKFSKRQLSQFVSSARGL